MNAHLDALQLRLSNERMRLADSRTANERALRKAWIAQIEKEIKAEASFSAVAAPEQSDDELLGELLS